MRTGALRRVWLIVAAVAVGLGTLPAGAAWADIEIIDDFEIYPSSNDLRSTWTVGGVGPATIDLECGSGTCWPTDWCSSHSTEGPAYDGCHYLRLNFLFGSPSIRVAVDPPQDWSDTDSLAFYFRGRNAVDNGAADMQLILIGNGGQTYYGPVIPGSEATQCPSDPCAWKRYVAPIAGHPALSSVTEIQILLSNIDRNGRVYIDLIERVFTGPTYKEGSTWGRIKALYR